MNIDRNKRPRAAPLPTGSGQRWLCISLLLIAAYILVPSTAFLPMKNLVVPSSKLQMIGNVFGGGDASKEPQLPKDVKDAISKCRGAVQSALGDRISRMVRTYIILSYKMSMCLIYRLCDQMMHNILQLQHD